MKYFRYFLFLLLPAFFLGCDDPLEGIKLQIATDDVLKYNYRIQVSNANVYGTVPSELRVELSGPDADKLVDVSGDFTINAVEGQAVMALMPGIEPSASNPVQFTLKISADGFVDYVQPIVWQDTVDGFMPVVLLQPTALPEGMGYVRQTLTAAVNPITGNMIATQTVEVPTSTEKPLKASIAIEAGTSFLNESGNPITGTDLEIQVIQYTDLNEAALNAFPGGFAIANALDENGQPIENGVHFTTAGMVKIDMKLDNQPIKAFSRPLRVTLGLNAATLNPEKEYAPVKAGDTAPIWSGDATSGAWQLEGNTTFATNAEGELVATFDVDHLSWWNIDWWWFRRCNPMVSVQSNVTTRGNKQYYYELVNTRSNQIVNSGFSGFINNQRMTFWSMPQGTTLQLKVYDGNAWWNRGNLLAESNAFSSCGSGTLNIQLPIANAIAIRAVGRCSNNKNTELRPTLGLWIEQEVTWSSFWGGSFTFTYLSYVGRMQNGQIILPSSIVERGRAYTFVTFFRGRKYARSLTLNADRIEIDLNLPNDFCSGL